MHWVDLNVLNEKMLGRFGLAGPVPGVALYKVIQIHISFESLYNISSFRFSVFLLCHSFVGSCLMSRNSCHAVCFFLCIFLEKICCNYKFEFGWSLFLEKKTVFGDKGAIIDTFNREGWTEVVVLIYTPSFVMMVCIWALDDIKLGKKEMQLIFNLRLISVYHTLIETFFLYIFILESNQRRLGHIKISIWIYLYEK